MAKFGSFFRRLFTPTSSDDKRSLSSPLSTSEPRTNMLIIPGGSPSLSSTPKSIVINTQSCTTSPRIMVKQTTLSADNTNATSKSNYLSSDINRINLRRLSAPLLIQTSAHHHHQYPSTIVNENTEEILLSSLQRSSLSSSTTTTVHSNYSSHNLTTSSGGGGGGSSGSPLSRPEIRSASFNLTPSPSTLSNNLVNNLSTVAGKLRKLFLFFFLSRHSIFCIFKHHKEVFCSFFSQIFYFEFFCQ